MPNLQRAIEKAWNNLTPRAGYQPEKSSGTNTKNPDRMSGFFIAYLLG